MDIFISWSGKRSRFIAEVLHDWLPMIISNFKPWLSSADIDKGVRWASEIGSKLEAVNAGIICITRSNVDSRWILFETGALSKTVSKTFVCPLLIDLEPSDVEFPLAQFQFTKLLENDIFELVRTLNKALVENAVADRHLEKAFMKWWPELETQLKNLPPDEFGERSTRPERDVLEEILGIVRNLGRSSDSGDKQDQGPEALDSQTIFSAIRGPDSLLEAERLHISRILKEESGNVAKAAARLGLSRSSLYERIKRLGIVGGVD